MPPKPLDVSQGEDATLADLKIRSGDVIVVQEGDAGSMPSISTVDKAREVDKLPPYSNLASRPPPNSALNAASLKPVATAIGSTQTASNGSVPKPVVKAAVQQTTPSQPLAVPKIAQAARQQGNIGQAFGSSASTLASTRSVQTQQATRQAPSGSSSDKQTNVKVEGKTDASSMLRRWLT